VKACGVVVAMVQGHSWVPIPSKGSWMNVGPFRLSRTTIAASGVPDRVDAWPAGREGTEGPYYCEAGKAGYLGRGPAGSQHG
jgi:hypothetical protein